MFDKHQKMIVDSTRNIVLLFVKENALKGVNVQRVWIIVLSVENGVAKREEPRRVIEEGTEDRIPIPRIVIGHTITSEWIVLQSNRKSYTEIKNIIPEKYTWTRVLLDNYFQIILVYARIKMLLNINVTFKDCSGMIYWR